MSSQILVLFCCSNQRLGIWLCSLSLWTVSARETSLPAQLGTCFTGPLDYSCLSVMITFPVLLGLWCPSHWCFQVHQQYFILFCANCGHKLWPTICCLYGNQFTTYCINFSWIGCANWVHRSSPVSGIIKGHTRKTSWGWRWCIRVIWASLTLIVLDLIKEDSKNDGH